VLGLCSQTASALNGKSYFFGQSQRDKKLREKDIFAGRKRVVSHEFG
jgi:hypothetical protein